MRNVMLGLKREIKHDARTLMLDRYLRTDSTPLPPKATNWREKTGQLAMLLNDKNGTCGPAGALHEVQSWVNCDGGSFVPTDDMCLKAYTALSGFDPITGKNDNGVNLLDQCNYWLKTGIGGHKLGAYAKLRPRDHGQVMDVTYLFDGLGAGWALPLAYKSAKVWRAPPNGQATGMWQAGSWGRHYGPIVDYTAVGPIVMSWGGYIQVEWAAYDLYSDEGYAYFSPDWFGDDASAPNGFDLTGLIQDYKDVTGKPAPAPPTAKTRLILEGPPWTVTEQR